MIKGTARGSKGSTVGPASKPPPRFPFADVPQSKRPHSFSRSRFELFTTDIATANAKNEEEDRSRRNGKTKKKIDHEETRRTKKKIDHEETRRRKIDQEQLEAKITNATNARALNNFNDHTVPGGGKMRLRTDPFMASEGSVGLAILRLNTN